MGPSEAAVFDNRSHNDSVKQRKFPLPDSLKKQLLAVDFVREFWTKTRCRQLHFNYARRRDYYHTKAQQMGLAYCEKSTIQQIRDRIRARGYTPQTKLPGEVHTFACIPTFGWHEHLLPDLRELGPTTHFDYTKLGFDLLEMAQANRRSVELKRQMTKLIMPAIREAHKERPVDWVFCYGGGQDTSIGVIEEITKELGIPVVNMALDDKQGWAGRWMDGCRTGTVDITAAFDMYVTSARVACEWHMVEGGRAIYMPEGYSESCYHPTNKPKDIAVSFIGAAYGFRVSTIKHLIRHGCEVAAFGEGWGTRSVWRDEQVDIINRSIINLGMGGIEYSESLTNVKTRDFEIPGTGGGVYLTSFNPDLAQHFIIGEEILCYRNRDELLELIRYYVQHRDEAAAIAQRGRLRCQREHRWYHRYHRMLQILGIFKDR